MALQNYKNFGQGRHALGTFIAYIAGVEVPVNSVSLHFAIGGQDPTALVSLAPHQLITRLGAEDRVDVQVFFLDQFTNPKNPQYRLLFEGVITGWAFQRDAVTVMIQLTVQGLLSSFRTLTAEYLTSVSQFANFNALEGNKIGIASSELTFPWSVILFGLSQHEEGEHSGEGERFELQQIRRPFDFVFNFLRLIFESKAHETFGSVASAYFYGLLQSKLNLFYRFLPSPIIETTVGDQVTIPVLEAFQNQAVVLSAMGRQATSLGYSVPMLDVILQILQVIYFELQQLPAPPLVIADMDVKKNPAFGEVISAPDDTASRKDTDKTVLASCVTKPLWFFGAVPKCNIVFPSMIQEVHFEENFQAQPTRVFVNDNSLYNLFGVSEADYGNLMAFTAGYPEKLNEELAKRLAGTCDPALSGKNLLLWPEEFYKGIVHVSIPLPEWIMFLAEAQSATTVEAQVLHRAMQRVLAIRAEYEGSSVTPAADEANRLQQQVLDLKAQLDEATTDEARETITKKIEETKEKWEKLKKSVYEEKKSLTTASQQFVDSLKSVVHSLVESPNISVQAREAFNRLKQELDNAPADTASALMAVYATVLNRIVDQFRGPLYNVYRKYAAYEYWRLRGEQRAGALTMVFNPYIVPGFPIFVFDAAATGQHFFAYVTDVRHELSSAGRLTQINFTHVMLLSEYLELLFRTKEQLMSEAQYYLSESDSGYNLAQKVYSEYETLPDLSQSLARDKFMEELGYEPKREIPSEEVRKRQRLQYLFTSDLVAVPLNPISHYAIVTQTLRGAGNYFNKLFWYGKSTTNPLFNPLMMLQLVYKTEDGKLEPYYVEEVVQQLMYFSDPANRISKNKPNPWNLERALEYEAVYPVKELQACMQNYEAALLYVQRPVCSLDQYVQFREQSGMVAPSVKNTDDRGKGHEFPVQLLDATKSGDTQYWYNKVPQCDDNNILKDPDTLDKLPRYRRNWQRRLLRYRTQITALRNTSEENQE